MKKAIIIYKSRTGITKKFGESIHEYLLNKNILSQIKSIDEVDKFGIEENEFVFLGCWTNGLLFFMQKPEKKWIEFAQKLPILDNNRLILFTTYKVRTGTMFDSMKRHLKFQNGSEITFGLKSRNGDLSEDNKLLIDRLIKV